MPVRVRVSRFELGLGLGLALPVGVFKFSAFVPSEIYCSFDSGCGVGVVLE